MPKQRRLRFLEQEFLETLWDGFPAAARHEVTAQYARLIARQFAERVRAEHPSKEVPDEPTTR